MRQPWHLHPAWWQPVSRGYEATLEEVEGFIPLDARGANRGHARLPCLSASPSALWRGCRRCDTTPANRMSFLADFLGNCAIAFPIRPLMRQKCAFRYFGPEGTR